MSRGRSVFWSYADLLSSSVSSVKTLEEAKVARGCLYMQMPVQEVRAYATAKFPSSHCHFHSLVPCNLTSSRKSKRRAIMLRKKSSRNGKRKAAYLPHSSARGTQARLQRRRAEVPGGIPSNLRLHRLGTLDFTGRLTVYLALNTLRIALHSSPRTPAYQRSSQQLKELL